jgi:hypothetical protein
MQRSLHADRVAADNYIGPGRQLTSRSYLENTKIEFRVVVDEMMREATEIAEQLRRDHAAALHAVNQRHAQRMDDFTQRTLSRIQQITSLASVA